MISIIIPTRNRAYTLRQVAPTYYCQPLVNQVIIVDDCGDDDTRLIASELRDDHPEIETIYIRHSKRKGASAARISGYSVAKNEYILFGEDDAWLGDDYVSILLEKFQNDPNLAIVSGRIIYLLPGESAAQARNRFGDGLRKEPYLNRYSMCFNKDCCFSGDLIVPFTHALFLTRRDILLRYKYDPFYRDGNGFREETDYQLNVFTNGLTVKVTSDTYCYHMNYSDVQSGGQRIGRIFQLLWNVYYTNYMYDKYFDNLKRALEIPYSKRSAKFVFATWQFYKLFVWPFVRFANQVLNRLSK